MKSEIIKLIDNALKKLSDQGLLEKSQIKKFIVEEIKDKKFGDFSSNVSMVHSKSVKMKPIEFAESIVKAISKSDFISNISIAGPGFINFHLNKNLLSNIIFEINEKKENYGKSNYGKNKKIHIEFVSANPTGPLHVGHGRGAAYGSVIANLLNAIGFEVHREYYVNDAGRQMDILALSVWFRYLELIDSKFNEYFPTNCYQGDYIQDIAAKLLREQGDIYFFPLDKIFPEELNNKSQKLDEEKNIDFLISKAKSLLDKKDYDYIYNSGLNMILGDISNDLSLFKVDFDEWFYESSLLKKENLIDKAMQYLGELGLTYKKDKAVWFRAKEFNDEKDRVLIRENGKYTYFASDIAYHLSKIEKGFDQIINIWGADHHGYVPRIKAAVEAILKKSNKLNFLLVQFAVLYEGGKKKKMSTRSGEFVTLRELRKDVGVDAARFFYLMRKSDQHMDFDLDLAKSKTSENPVYYVQYAHARIASVLRQAEEKNLDFKSQKEEHLSKNLANEHEIILMKKLAQYPEVVEKAALHSEPHRLINYLRELSTGLHTYYNSYQFLVDDQSLRNARLNLIMSIKQVLFNGLKLIGISAPNEM